MALEKKDVRFKLDPDDKEALVVEQWVVGQIRREIHQAKVITERLARRGISGIRGEGKRSA